MNIRENFVLGSLLPADIDAPPQIIEAPGGYACFDSLPPFEHKRAQSVAEAVALLRKHGAAAEIIAGGQDLLRRLRDRVHRASPKLLIDIKRVPGLDAIRVTDTEISIGAAATLASIAQNEAVHSRHPILAQAAYQSGPAQYRNVATLGGDLCREVRCWYFRASGNTYDCRRKCGSQCPALSGDNRHHGIFGSRDCASPCPSDTATTLAALGATVRMAGIEGEREMPVESFHLPLKNALAEGEMVTEVRIPSAPAGSRSHYEKATISSMFDPEIASIAMVADMDGDTCRSARIFLGGVGPSPWRLPAAEALLAGRTLDETLASQAGEAAVTGAWPLSGNAYKVDIARALVRRAVLAIAGKAA